MPVDSEHSAHGAVPAGRRGDEVRRLVLTASGGPFRGWSRDRLDDVTPEQALAHPTWNMGPLVTINSATLVNKGLEVIEAHLLFGFGLDRIDVVVHPQSIVHSMVEFADGATMIQASPPDMRLPISLGLAWPDRVPDAAPGLDWSAAATWTFEPLDDAAFPAVALAREAAAAGGTCRPSTTPRTRSAWPPSWREASASPGLLTPWPGYSLNTTPRARRSRAWRTCWLSTTGPGGGRGS